MTIRDWENISAAVQNIYDQRNLVFGKQRTSVDAFVIAQLWLRLYTVLYLQYTYQQIDFLSEWSLANRDNKHTENIRIHRSLVSIDEMFV